MAKYSCFPVAHAFISNATPSLHDGENPERQSRHIGKPGVPTAGKLITTALESRSDGIRPLRSWQAGTLLLMIAFSSATTSANDLESQLKECLWQLAATDALPDRYALAVKGTSCLVIERTADIHDSEFAFLKLWDKKQNASINAIYRDQYNPDTKEAVAGRWIAAFKFDTRREFWISRIQAYRFKVDGPIEDELVERLKVMDQLFYEFHPMAAPIAPSQFHEKAIDPNFLVFAIYDQGRIVKDSEIGGMISTEWVPGTGDKCRVHMRFQRYADEKLLPVYCRWEVPFPEGVDTEDERHTQIVVRTTWKKLNALNGTTHYWLPQEIQISRILGFRAKQNNTTQDLSYKLYWRELEEDSDLVAKWDQGEVDWKQEWKRVVTSVEEQSGIAK